jgi:hypothetical protein
MPGSTRTRLSGKRPNVSWQAKLRRPNKWNVDILYPNRVISPGSPSCAGVAGSLVEAHSRHRRLTNGDASLSNQAMSAIFGFTVTGSFRIQRRSARSKIGVDHVGDDGARLDKVECGEGRIHLVQTFAPTQRLIAQI